MRHLIACLLLATASLPLAAASLNLQQGNLLLEDAGQSRLLLDTHDVREAVLSADGRQAVLVRSQTTADGESSALWLLDTAGSGEPRRLLESRPADEPKQNLTDFNTLAFSADGRQLYFLSSAWATSSALHRLDLQSGQTQYLSDANDLRVIGTGKHAGKLLVQKHKYRTGGGSQEVWYLIDASGRELRRLGEGEKVLQDWLR